jgi:hypothetical protein
MTLEQLAIELAEARFGRGININRTPAERCRAGMIWSEFEAAKRDRADPERVARAEAKRLERQAALIAMWRYSARAFCC